MDAQLIMYVHPLSSTFKFKTDSIHINPLYGIQDCISGFGCGNKWYNAHDLESVARFARRMENFNCIKVHYYKVEKIENTEY